MTSMIEDVVELTVGGFVTVMPPFLVGFISRLVFKRRVSCAAQVFGRGLFRLSPC
jgi:hypothetical protein